MTQHWWCCRLHPPTAYKTLRSLSRIRVGWHTRARPAACSHAHVHQLTPRLGRAAPRWNRQRAAPQPRPHGHTHVAPTHRAAQHRRPRLRLRPPYACHATHPPPRSPPHPARHTAYGRCFANASPLALRLASNSAASASRNSRMRALRSRISSLFPCSISFATSLSVNRCRVIGSVLIRDASHWHLTIDPLTALMSTSRSRAVAPSSGGGFRLRCNDRKKVESRADGKSRTVSVRVGRSSPRRGDFDNRVTAPRADSAATPDSAKCTGASWPPLAGRRVRPKAALGASSRPSPPTTLSR
eukprot:scaffold120235_cov48-Phaeocystis_antarctica.AAC.3